MTANPTPQRPRWSFRRFLNTLFFFDAIPLIGQLHCLRQMLGHSPHTATATVPQPWQKGAVLVVGNAAQLAPLLISQLRDRGYQVRWLSAQGSVAASADAMQQADLPPLNASPPNRLQDVQTIVGCPTHAEMQFLVPWLAAIAPDLHAAQPLLFDFTQPNARVEDWGALDDGVMGGVSESSLRQHPEGARFAGNVSTANSGGFASVRTRNFSPPLNLSCSAGLELRVRGDGNRYKLMLRSESGWDSLAYAVSFDTQAHRWITVRLPFSELRPVFRARTVTTAHPIDTSRIHAIQLMLSKFEYDGSLNPHFTPGAFELTLASINTYGSPTPPQVVLALSPGASGLASLVEQIAVLKRTLQQSQIPFALFRVGAIVEGKGTTSLVIVQSGETPGTIDRNDLAQLCIEAIATPQASGITATVASGQGVCPPGDWRCLFDRMRS